MSDVLKTSVAGQLLSGWIDGGISTSPKKLFSSSFGNDSGRAYKGVELYALSTNADSIYVKAFSGVTADQDSRTGGRELPAGASWFVPLEDASQLWAISASGTLHLHWTLV